MDKIIEVASLKKSYGNVKAVKGIAIHLNLSGIVNKLENKPMNNVQATKCINQSFKKL